MFKLKGNLKVVNVTTQVSEKFSKREFVLTTTEDIYPQDVQFQLSQDKCLLLDGYNVGDELEVSFNLRGREWVNQQGEAKYFNTLDAWRLDRISLAPLQPLQPKPNTVQPIFDEKDDSGLPF